MKKLTHLKNTAAPHATPTRDDILAFIARGRATAEKAGAASPGKIGKREIARAFDIKGADRIALKRMLKELELQGAVERRGRALAKPGALPPVVAANIVARDRDGDLIAEPDEWDAAAGGPPPRILVDHPRKPRPGAPAPGVGDRVLLRVERNRRAERDTPHYSGRVIKALAKANARLIGVFHAAPNGGGRIAPIDKKSLNRELAVAPGGEADAVDGDLVSVEPTRERHFGLPAVRIRERLGSVRGEAAISLIALKTHGIPYEFSADALAEAEAARPATMRGREDWRDLPLVTIDPADARDHDDAIYATPDDDPANEGGFIIVVAIADVAAYVRAGSAMDREALDRGNSVYFPGRVVPMLPERISNDLCSLKANVDRPALAARMIIDKDGRKRRHSFHRIMMRSAAKLAYPQAQAAIDGAPDAIAEPLLEPALKPLWAAYDALKIERAHRSPLDLDLPERKLLLKPDGSIDRVIVPPRLDAHRLIEEFMILANVAAAETLEDKRQPLIYRAHDEPTQEKLHALSEFLATIGVKLAKGQALKTRQFNGILARAHGGEHEGVVNETILRTQAQAEYANENYGHFGLNLRRYAHFTSPIRRYADLVVHRALIRALGFGDDGLRDMSAEDLSDIAERISSAERRAMAAERETNDRLIATFLADRIGATFEGRISGVTRAGLFVKLRETGADGFVPAATVGADYYRFEEAHRALIGARTGETFRLGDTIEVKLVEAAPLAGALRFAIVSEGRRSGARFGVKGEKVIGRDARSDGKRFGSGAQRSRSKRSGKGTK